ncbi:hypothetical protein BDZ89DRAFT_1061652 [Hymenopellis radicata]|nr:hypothetical protein BDZ89DRAFT_1061652 [Hymenopellis radicata]
MSRLSSLLEEKRPHKDRPLYSSNFHELPERKQFLQIFVSACLAMIVVMFAVFSIYWGALWKLPAHPLRGWIVDLDGSASRAGSKIAWETWSRNEDANEIATLVREENAWVAVVVNVNATRNLANPIAGYDPTRAVTIYATEARNENAFRTLIRPITEATLSSARVQNISAGAFSELVSVAPQVITEPLSYTLVNLAPFDIPVASAMTFVGLIYLLILSFFIIMIGVNARLMSGLESLLSTASLIRLRMACTFIAFCFLSLFYSLLSVAFQVDFTRKFGHSGFLVFWMVNYVGMLAVGLALEAMLSLMTQRFVPFFMIFFVVANVSVCFMPIDVLPRIFRYGYAMPFYNVSCVVRTVLFGTKNQVGLHFGILIAWVVVSMITLPLFTWITRRSVVRSARSTSNAAAS